MMPFLLIRLLCLPPAVNQTMSPKLFITAPFAFILFYFSSHFFHKSVSGPFWSRIKLFLFSFKSFPINVSVGDSEQALYFSDLAPLFAIPLSARL
ncbi:hypothetical protein J3E68DRAFT_85557 [Trichoderma sp. SZMC 28012]